MIRNYLAVALRSIFRNKLTAFINIAGLALAMTCVLMIYLFVSDELKYDQYHSKADRIYRVTRDFLTKEGEISLRLGHVAPPIGTLIKNDFGEIEVMARTINMRMLISLEENGEVKKSVDEKRLFIAEPDLFKIFDFNVVQGDKSTGLSRPFTVMLSSTTAQKYFGNETAVGKRLRVRSSFDLEVTGVFEDFPLQSHWHPELLISFSSLQNKEFYYGASRLDTDWGNNSFGTYILLDEGASIQNIETRMPEFLDKHFGAYAITNYGAGQDFVASKTTQLHFQKVTDIHLRSNLDSETEVNGNINNVYMMSIIGMFIILIACFNFINLSTANAMKRGKEVGMRKVVGAHKRQLIGLYLSESVLTAFIALLFASVLSLVSIQWLNDFTNKQLSLDWLSPFPLGLFMVTVLVGLLAGVYPAFFIARFKPVEVLKGKQGTVPGKGRLRQGLVVAQFSISIVLIIATAIIFQQLDFLNSRDLGYDREQVIVLPYYGQLDRSYDAFYNELTKSPYIKNAARSSRIPTGSLLDSYGSPRILKGDSLIDSGVSTKFVCTDAGFMDTYGVRLVAGRDFSTDIPTDDSLAFIINEEAVKQYGWGTAQEAIDKDFEYANRKGKVVGVVKDFHFESLHQEIIPLIFFQDYFDYVSIKITKENLKEGLVHVNNLWKQFLPNRPFDYEFMSDNYTRLYDAEKKQSELFTIFSGLAIFIACLGLFGLATFNTLQRVKEIGIRKVLGASVPSILSLLGKEIVVLIVIANAVAWPLSWYLMNSWLGNFAYHISLSPWIFLVASIVTISIALATVSVQSVKASLTNPANTLRYE